MQLFQQLSVDTFVILCTERVLVIKRCVTFVEIGIIAQISVQSSFAKRQEAGLIVPYLMNLTQRLQLHNDAKHSEEKLTKFILQLIINCKGTLYIYS